MNLGSPAETRLLHAIDQELLHLLQEMSISWSFQTAQQQLDAQVQHQSLPQSCIMRAPP